MRIEIAIAGPAFAVMCLFKVLTEYSPGMEEWPEGKGQKKGRAQLLVTEDHQHLDETLKEISSRATALEKTLCLEERFEFRVRNLAYAEPRVDNRHSFQPFDATPSVTIVPWRPGEERPTGPRRILLDPQNAFGTGKHPTTRLCLELMQELNRQGPKDRDLQGINVLDFGCGTGLLAIAAVKMGAGRAEGIEIDSNSADAARKNVKLNGLSDKIAIRKGSWEVVKGTFDLILANVVPAVLVRTGVRIQAHLKKSGSLIISGFGVNQAVDIESRFENFGFVTIHRSNLQGWAALVMNKTFSKDRRKHGYSGN